jgi:GNAT superfamily N-acetyltransferase
MDVSGVRTVELREGHRHAALQLLRAGFALEDRRLLEVEISRGLQFDHGIGRMAFDSDRPVGVVLARTLEGRALFLVYLTVAADYRRRGVASRLIAEAVVATGAPTIELLLEPGNQTAKRLYAGGGLHPSRSPAPKGKERWSGRWTSRPGPCPLLCLDPGRHSDQATRLTGACHER